jgi:hypothetical protein
MDTSAGPPPGGATARRERRPAGHPGAPRAAAYADLRPLLGMRVIAVEGAVDRDGIAQLLDRCAAARESGATAVVVDFTRMTACPSALFLTVLQVNARFRAARVPLHLIGLEEAVFAIAGARSADPPRRRAG